MFLNKEVDRTLSFAAQNASIIRNIFLLNVFASTFWCYPNFLECVASESCISCACRTHIVLCHCMLEFISLFHYR